MKNERLLNFFEELKAPIHSTQRFERRTATDSNEFIVDNSWSILLTAGYDDQIKMAAIDLKEFLEQQVNINIDIIYNRTYDAKNLKNVIVIDSSTSFGLTKAESYRITCAENSIIINGADSSGLMYAVFYLEDLMKFRGAAVFKSEVIERSPNLTCRIFRSPMSFYYDDDELLKANDAYPDSYLRKLAQQSFNGVWVRGILRKLVKNTNFPEFGKNSEKFIIALERLIKRCSKFGIKVYLYCTEPLGFPQDSEFFRKYEHLRGHAYDYQQSNALCSSEPFVKDYLRFGFNKLFSQLNDLGGVILITASEHQCHCYSNCSVIEGKKVGCEKCAKRTPAEVIGEVISLINEGVKSAQKNAKVIAWNWSWSIFYNDPQSEIIAKIPQDVIIMGDFERGGITEICGTEHKIDEYSLSYIGPSERFVNSVSEAKKQGHEVFAKLQLCVTHEIATVPYWPVLPKIVAKLLQLKDIGCDGVMGCWNFGNILSRNSELAHWCSWNPSPENADDILQAIAKRDFGSNVAEDFVKCWHIFSEASDFYPFSNEFVYAAPMNYGAAYQFCFKPVNKSLPVVWMLPEEMKYNINYECMNHAAFGDLYKTCTRKFGTSKTLEYLKKMNRKWQAGLDLMQVALLRVSDRLKENAEHEYRVCSAIHCQFRSLINFIEFTKNRNLLYQETIMSTKESILKSLIQTARDEYDNSLTSRNLSQEETSLGFHGEAFGFMYTPEKIDKKIGLLQHILTVEIPEYTNTMREIK